MYILDLSVSSSTKDPAHICLLTYTIVFSRIVSDAESDVKTANRRNNLARAAQIINIS